MSTVRHFTATGFVVHGNRILLHWHPKVRAWLPPGGHVEENEDPVQAVQREVCEETGIQVQVFPTGQDLGLDYPTQIQPPFTIMIEDIYDLEAGYHQHIDMIYFCSLVGPPTPLRAGWIWINRQHLVDRTPLENTDNSTAPPPEDVCLIGIQAIDILEE